MVHRADHTEFCWEETYALVVPIFTCEGCSPSFLKRKRAFLASEAVRERAEQSSEAIREILEARKRAQPPESKTGETNV
jgi:hypothetical protein